MTTRPQNHAADALIGVRTPIGPAGFVTLVDYHGNDAATALFTPVKWEEGRINIDGVTLVNVRDHIDRIEAEIAIVADLRKRNWATMVTRRSELAKVLLLVPGNKTKSGQLCAAGQKMVEAVIPSPAYTSDSDLWTTLWCRIRPQGNGWSCWSRKDMERNLDEVARQSVQVAQQSSRMIKAREVLLRKFQEDPTANANLGELLVSGSEERVVSKAEGILRKEWIAEQYEDGDEVHIDCCDDCSLWVIGEHRCSCGNRRMNLESYGSFLDGTGCAYPAAY